MTDKNPPDKTSNGDADEYGTPSQRNRFKPKQSGNSKGRGKGVKNRRTIVMEVAGEMYSVPENGKHKRRSALELVVLVFRQLSAETKSAKVIRAYNDFEEKFGTPDPVEGGGWIVVPEGLTPEEWNARFAKPKPDSAE